MGCVHRELGDTDRAMEAFKQALKINEENANAHLNLAATYCRTGRLDQARKHAFAAGKLGSPKTKIDQLIDLIKNISQARALTC